MKWLQRGWKDCTQTKSTKYRQKRSCRGQLDQNQVESVDCMQKRCNIGWRDTAHVTMTGKRILATFQAANGRRKACNMIWVKGLAQSQNLRDTKPRALPTVLQARWPDDVLIYSTGHKDRAKVALINYRLSQTMDGMDQMHVVLVIHMLTWPHAGWNDCIEAETFAHWLSPIQALAEEIM